MLNEMLMVGEAAAVATDPLLVILKSWGIPTGSAAALLVIGRWSIPAILAAWSETVQVHKTFLQQQADAAKERTAEQVNVNRSQTELVRAIDATVTTARELLREVRDIHWRFSSEKADKS